MAGHDGYTRYTVRIPDALYKRIKAAAGEKSVNAEIVLTLEHAYPSFPEEVEHALTLMRQNIELVADENYDPDIESVRKHTAEMYAKIDRWLEKYTADIPPDPD